MGRSPILNALRPSLAATTIATCATLLSTERLPATAACHPSRLFLAVVANAYVIVNRVLRSPQMTLSTMRCQPSAGGPENIDTTRDRFKMARINAGRILAHMIYGVPFRNRLSGPEKGDPMSRCVLAVVRTVAVTALVQVKRPGPALVFTFAVACLCKCLFPDAFVPFVGPVAHNGSILPQLFIVGGLFDFITDPIKALLTPAGTARNNADVRAKTQPQTIAGNLLTTLAPTLQKQAEFQGQMWPKVQSTITDTMNLATPAGVQDQTEQVRRAALNAALENLPQQEQMLQQGGAGIGAIQGARISAINKAHETANMVMQMYATPEGRMKLLQLVMGAFGAAGPDWGGLSQGANIIYGRPSPPVGASPLATIGGIAGMFTGMGGGGGSDLWGNPSSRPGDFSFGRRN